MISSPKGASLIALVATLIFSILSSALDAEQSDKWLEVRSRHFVVVSNAGGPQAQRVSLELERVRTMLQRSLTKVRVDPRQPLVVLAVGDENGLRELLPQSWEHKGQRPAAAYWGGPNRHCIALRVDASAPQVFGRVLHEYIHLLTHANVPDLPVWLDEGISEFWSTAVLEEDAVEIGRPPARDLRVLRASRSWIPLGELLAMKRTPDARDKKRLSLFYAQSWAVTHYLLLGGSSNHVELAPSVPVTDAAQLEGVVSAYVRARRFRALRIEGGAGEEEKDDATVRTMSVAQSLAVRAGCLTEGQRPAAAEPLLSRAFNADPNDPSVLETLGYLNFLQNKPMDAAGWFDRVIASGRATYQTYFYRAILVGPVPTKETASAADYLKTAIELNPDFAPAYARLADIYGEEPGRLDEAVRMMRRAAELEPQNPAYMMGLERLLAGMDKRP